MTNSLSIYHCIGFIEGKQGKMVRKEMEGASNDPTTE